MSEPFHVATAPIQSHTAKGVNYCVKLYLECECEGFKNNGFCQHLQDALAAGRDWSITDDFTKRETSRSRSRRR